MSTAVRELLSAFEALPEADRSEVVSELLARHPISGGDIPDEAFVEIAAEVFRAYDAAEDADAAAGR